jgi:molybdate transport system regulatory protein
MSYKRAWDLVNAMNKGFKEDLVTTKIGGSHGGGAEVTEFGFKILRLYRSAIKASHLFIENEMSDLMTHLNHE